MYIIIIIKSIVGMLTFMKDVSKLGFPKKEVELILSEIGNLSGEEKSRLLLQLEESFLEDYDKNEDEDFIKKVFLDRVFGEIEELVYEFLDKAPIYYQDVPKLLTHTVFTEDEKTIVLETYGLYHQKGDQLNFSLLKEYYSKFSDELILRSYGKFLNILAKRK